MLTIKNENTKLGDIIILLYGGYYHGNPVIRAKN